MPKAAKRPRALTIGLYCVLAVLAVEVLATASTFTTDLTLLKVLVIFTTHVLYAALLVCAFRGYLWARVMLLVCSAFIICVASIPVYAFLQTDGPLTHTRVVGWMTAGTLCLGMALQAIAVAMLFMPSSRAWFTLKRTVTSERNCVV